MSDAPTPEALEASALALIGRVLAAEIDEGLLALLRDRAVATLFARCEPDCDRVLAGPWGAAQYEAAHVEYCRLFVVPQLASPRAGSWLSAEDASGGVAIPDLVDALVEAVELELPADLAALPRDHVAVLLGIAAWLTEHRHPAAREFIDRTLAPWVGRFSGALATRAESPIYRACGRFLAAAC
ncbi:MAG TPA: molecular chaperone TorD family protein [Gammaproteobacteria bacterium]